MLGLMTVPFLSLPGLAFNDDYMEGYTEGLKVGTFIGYCTMYRYGEYDDRSKMIHMLRATYDKMDAANQRWAREETSECVF